jgi:Dolichyl-phosphate-mannose-protein mannosyltransferase
MRRRWPVLTLLLASVLLIHLATAGGHLYSPDEEVMYRVTESLVHGRLAIEPLSGFGTQTGRGGLEYAQYGLGNSIAAVPFRALGPLFAAVWPGDELREILSTSSFVNAQRYRYPTAIDYARRFAVSHMNIAVALLQIWVLYLFALALTNRPWVGVVVGLLYAFATQAWPHSKTFFSEPLATLSLTSGAYLVWSGMERRSALRLWFAGAALGWAMLTRLDSILALPGLALMFYLLLLRPEPSDEEGPRLSPLWAHLAIAIPLLLAMAVILGLNTYKFGGPLTTGYGDQAEGFEFNTSLLESLPGFLWSPGRSIFMHSPPVLLGVIGLVALIRRDRSLGLGVLGAFLVTLLVQAMWQNWSGGWDWGPRHIYSLIAWSMIPLTALLGERSFLSPRVAIALCAFVGALGVWVQSIAISENPLEYYDIHYRPHVENGMLTAPRAMIHAQSRGEMLPEGNDLMWHREYLPWSGYPEMWSEGIHDLFWLRWWQWRRSQRSSGDE